MTVGNSKHSPQATTAPTRRGLLDIVLVAALALLVTGLAIDARLSVLLAAPVVLMLAAGLVVERDASHEREQPLKIGIRVTEEREPPHPRRGIL